jgi:4-hydroxybenzoate polyprenyltransferase
LIVTGTLTPVRELTRTSAALPLPIIARMLHIRPVNGEGLEHTCAQIRPLSPRAGKGGGGDRGKPRPTSKIELPKTEPENEREKTRAAGLRRLSRWREHVPFTVPATLLGINMAARQGYAIDARLAIIVLAANVLAVTFAFMVNDLEDAPDDARDPERGARNAITVGLITPRAGWAAALLVGLAAAALFAGLNRAAGAVGLITLALSFGYSWRGVRLKALPLVDVISHALMLSALLFLAGYLTVDAAPGRAWWVAAGVGLISAYGQLYNQLRDYALDRAAGLHNTARVLGARGTRMAMYGCLGGAALCLGITVVMGLWPLWLVIVPAGAAPLALARRSNTDMRGTAALDLSGRWQARAMGIANVMMLIWLVAEVI